MRRLLVVTLLITGLASSGCQVSTTERSFMRHEGDGVISVRKAPHNGEYRLYTAVSWKAAANRQPPIIERSLHTGDRVGFERDDKGRLVAVVQTDRQLLDLGSPGAGYVWTMQPDRGQTDLGKTLVLVGALAAVTIVVAVVVVRDAALSASLRAFH
jgi:hypothetical protein